MMGDRIPVDELVAERERAHIALERHRATRGHTGDGTSLFEQMGGTIINPEYEPDGSLWDDDGTLRTFSTGATRDTAEGKPEPWGFTSALAEKAFCEYMSKHRRQSDGSLRESDNWKKGIPLDVFMHSLSRHILDLKLMWEGYGAEAREHDQVEILCAIKFNVDGMLHEIVKRQITG